MPFIASDQRLYSTGGGTAGFLTMPAGTFRPDQAGVLTQAPSGQYSIGTAPVLRGAATSGYRSWNSSDNRWLPVPAEQVAEDGTSYVYQVGPDLHLVTVASGADRIIYHQPSGFPPANLSGPQLLAYVRGAVYISVNATYKGEGGSILTVPASEVGLWRIDPSGTAPRRVMSAPLVGVITSDARTVWTVESDSANPPSGTLVSYDLNSQQRTAWFNVPRSGLDFLGFDQAGNAIVWTYDYQGGLKIWIVTGPDLAQDIDSQTYTGNVPFYAGNNNEFGPLVTDSHGVWFGSTNGLFLYDTASLHEVAAVPGIPLGACT